VSSPKVPLRCCFCGSRCFRSAYHGVLTQACLSACSYVHRGGESGSCRTSENQPREDVRECARCHSTMWHNLIPSIRGILCGAFSVVLSRS
jgi:hypothetical protein